jgi:hypothetical protein
MTCLVAVVLDKNNRHCSLCDTTKPLNEFYKDKNRPLGHSYLCKPCGRAKKRNNEIRRDYGITQIEYQALLIKQNYSCAICQSTDPGPNRVKRFSIDHCHSTGKVRGLLCGSCNNGLGRFKDDPGILSKAIVYLGA